MISDTNKTMLNIVSVAIHNQRAEGIGVLNWEAIYEEMKAQSIHVLLSPYANQLGMTVDERKRYTIDIGNNLRQFYSILEEQSNVISCLEKESIPSVILKGAAAAVNYLHPEYRCMGDIDVLVPREEFERAFQALCAVGYKPQQKLDDFYRHIGFESENGVEIELHNFFSTSDNEQQNKELDNLLFTAIPNRVSANLNGYEFPILPLLENGIVLLAHINQHLRGGLGLRQIIDWMCYVERYLDDSIWQNYFAEVAERIGMKKLASVVTAMCQEYLGLSKDITWCSYEPVCDELMENILSHGNFGRKTGGTQNTTISVIRWFRNPIRGIIKAQKFGCRTWDACKKHPWLRPFAWIYQIIRWIKHGAVRGVDMQLLHISSSTEKRETELLERLGVTRL